MATNEAIAAAKAPAIASSDSAASGPVARLNVTAALAAMAPAASEEAVASASWAAGRFVVGEAGAAPAAGAAARPTDGATAGASAASAGAAAGAAVAAGLAHAAGAAEGDAAAVGSAASCSGEPAATKAEPTVEVGTSIAVTGSAADWPCTLQGHLDAGRRSGYVYSDSTMFAEAKFRYPCFQTGSLVPATAATIASGAAAVSLTHRTGPEPQAAASADRWAGVGSPWSAAGAAGPGTDSEGWPSAVVSQPSLTG